jgi:hypothetical protein
MDELSLFDVLTSLGAGLSLGWIVGGAWNMLQGKRWTGQAKEK